MKILDTNKIESLSIKVTEKIQNKNLLKFLRTSIQNSGIELSKNSYFYHNFIKESLTYEILVYEKPIKKQFILEPFLFIDKNISETIVYYTDSYFLIIENQQLLMLKKTVNTSKDDIKIYIEQVYKREIFDLVYVSPSEIKKLKSVTKNSFKHHNISVYPEKDFYFFVTFFLISFLLSSIYFTYNYTTKIDTLKESKSIKKFNDKTTKLKQPMNVVLVLFKYIKENNFRLYNFILEDKKIKIIVLHNKKEMLLGLLDKFINKTNVKLLKYDEEQKLFRMEVEIEY